MFYFMNIHWSGAKAYRKFLDMFGYKQKEDAHTEKTNDVIDGTIVMQT